MAVARAKGRLKGRQPKLSPRQQTELRRMHGTGDYTVTDLAELFKVSRPTVYRTLQREPISENVGALRNPKRATPHTSSPV
jgi:DNA invertase Pin-like site-specific DNA recombinase